MGPYKDHIGAILWKAFASVGLGGPYKLVVCGLESYIRKEYGYSKIQNLRAKQTPKALSHLITPCLGVRPREYNEGTFLPSFSKSWGLGL